MSGANQKPTEDEKGHRVQETATLHCEYNVCIGYRAIARRVAPAGLSTSSNRGASGSPHMRITQPAALLLHTLH